MTASTGICISVLTRKTNDELTDNHNTDTINNCSQDFEDKSYWHLHFRVTTITLILEKLQSRLRRQNLRTDEQINLNYAVHTLQMKEKITLIKQIRDVQK